MGGTGGGAILKNYIRFPNLSKIEWVLFGLNARARLSLKSKKNPIPVGMVGTSQGNHLYLFSGVLFGASEWLANFSWEKKNNLYIFFSEMWKKTKQNSPKSSE